MNALFWVVISSAVVATAFGVVAIFDEDARPSFRTRTTHIEKQQEAWNYQQDQCVRCHAPGTVAVAHQKLMEVQPVEELTTQEGNR